MATTGAPRNATLQTQLPETPEVPTFSVGPASTRPINPVVGYVFSNTTDFNIEQWTGLVWKVVGRLPEAQVMNGAGPTSQRPTNPRLGFLYLDTTLGQLIAWGGTAWIIIGPLNSAPPVLTPPVIVTQPTSQTAASGGSATFTVSATGTGVLTYQWFKNGVTIGGATAASYNIGTVAQSDGGNYHVVVTDSQGSTQSVTVVLTVTGAPFIVSNPVSQTVAPGAAVTFSVVATGTAPLSYQWYFNGAPISGANSASYTINGVTPSNVGLYSVIVTNSVGSTPSSTASLAVTTVTNAARWTTFSAGFGVASEFSSSIMGFSIDGTGGYSTVDISIAPNASTFPPGIELSMFDGAGTMIFNLISNGGESVIAIPTILSSDGQYTVRVNAPAAVLAVSGTITVSDGPGKFSNCSVRAPVYGSSLLPPDGYAVALFANNITTGSQLTLGFYEAESTTQPMVAPYLWNLGGDETNNPVNGFTPTGGNVLLTGIAPPTVGGAVRLEISSYE